MIATPAVDLRGGRCVQLVGGRPDDERISLPNPHLVAEDWWKKGFASLHIVDLDAAMGRGNNRGVIGKVVSSTRAETQVGGGVRDEDAVAALLEIGVARAVVGTRAVDDPEWLASTAEEFPHRLVVAADVEGGIVLRKGWTEGTGLRLEELLDRLADLPLAGVLCTDVGREGRMKGIDREGVAHALKRSPHPMWVSGGVTTMDELDFLADAGAAGVVLGMALYREVLDPYRVAAKYGAVPPAAGGTPGHGETQEDAPPDTPDEIPNDTTPAGSNDA